MFRLSSLFTRSAYTAPSGTVIEPAGRSSATEPRDVRTGRAATDAGTRAGAFAAEMAGRGTPVPTLAERFPHVLDRIGSAWTDPVLLAVVFEDLLVDDRGGREGFPAEAARELFALHRAATRGGQIEPERPGREGRR